MSPSRVARRLFLSQIPVFTLVRAEERDQTTNIDSRYLLRSKILILTFTSTRCVPSSPPRLLAPILSFGLLLLRFPPLESGPEESRYLPLPDPLFPSYTLTQHRFDALPTPNLIRVKIHDSLHLSRFGYLPSCLCVLWASGLLHTSSNRPCLLLFILSSYLINALLQCSRSLSYSEVR